MVFEISVAVTRIISSAVFSICFIGLRRAGRMVNHDFSVVIVQSGQRQGLSH